MKVYMAMATNAHLRKNEKRTGGVRGVYDHQRIPFIEEQEEGAPTPKRGRASLTPLPFPQRGRDIPFLPLLGDGNVWF